MKRKMNRVFMIVAAVLFLFMLVVNVRMALGNPFGYMDEGALEEETTQDNESNVDAVCTYIDEYGELHRGRMVICFPGTIDCSPTDCEMTIEI